MLTTYIIVAVVAYLLGSIPFGYILVRIFRGEDVRAIGSGNIGATNVARSGARGLGLLTLLLDVGKGATAVVIAGVISRHMFVEQWDLLSGMQTVYPHLPFDQAFAALMAVVGHMYPIWLRFQGGKGVATAAGAFLVISPLALAISLVAFGIAALASRFVSLGSILAAVVFPIAFWFVGGRDKGYFRYPYITYVLSAVIALLVILKHHANIRRLLAGTEHRFELKRTRA